MRASFVTAIEKLNTIVLGKEQVIEQAVVCLLANGHLLLEDIPGMGKTTLSQALAKVFGLAYKRVQFTNDMLPGDLLGVNIYDATAKGFRFHRGPIFSNLVLADEINRATPKTQSALLEAMEERQVSIDGKTRPLTPPFFVIATQNPLEQAGTYPLPESQLDRFTMRLSLGYPSEKSEKALLVGNSTRHSLSLVQPVLSTELLMQAQQQVTSVKMTDLLVDYVYRLVAASRRFQGVTQGLSPRGALVLVSCAKAMAWLRGRDHVIPEDVQAVFNSVATHRIKCSVSAEQIVAAIVESVDVMGSP